MPNRILKESICCSDNMNNLTLFQENMFFRLIVNCDDYGRMDARPAIVKAKLYPLKDYRLDQIEDALRALSSAELVILYEVDGKPFLQMKTWDRHQTIRAKKSKYPSPDEGKTLESNCKQMQADASKCSRNPIQSESESNRNIDDGEYTRTCARDGMDRMTEKLNTPQTAYEYLEQNGVDMSDPYIIEEYRDTMEMGFSNELVMYAASRAKAAGRLSWAYIRSTLVNWHEQGIKTVEQAKEDLNKHRANNRRNNQSDNGKPRTEYDLKPKFV